MSSSQLTNSYFSEGWRKTTNQTRFPRRFLSTNPLIPNRNSHIYQNGCGHGCHDAAFCEMLEALGSKKSFRLDVHSNKAIQIADIFWLLVNAYFQNYGMFWQSSGISSGICSGISSGIPSGILSSISSGILSGKSAGILSGKHGTLSGIWHSIWNGPFMAIFNSYVPAGNNYQRVHLLY